MQTVCVLQGGMCGLSGYLPLNYSGNPGANVSLQGGVSGKGYLARSLAHLVQQDCQRGRHLILSTHPGCLKTDISQFKTDISQFDTGCLPLSYSGNPGVYVYP
jgi:hypothetical protein